MGADHLSATADELLASARWHAATFGWGIFPAEAGGKRPARVAVHGFKDTTGHDGRIIASWGIAAFNPAVSTGYPGPDVLDVDVRPGGSGWEAFHWLKEAGLLAGAHRLVRTRAGGLHVYFRGTGQRCGSLKAMYVDFKSRGGYVLLPPSYVDAWHADDGIAGSYELLDDRPPTGATFSWEAAKRLLSPPKPVSVRVNGGSRGPGSVRHLPDWMAQQTSGNRNSALFWAACRAAEARNERVLIELVDAGVAAGLDRAEAYKTVVSAARKVQHGR